MAGKNEQLPLTKHSNKIIPNDIFTYFSGLLFVFSSLKHLFCNILKSLSVNLTLVSFTHNLFGYQYIVWLLLISFNYKRQNYAFTGTFFFTNWKHSHIGQFHWIWGKQNSLHLLYAILWSVKTIEITSVGVNTW